MEEDVVGGVAGEVWLRPQRIYRASPLTRERLVEEAVALLDQEGAGQLTMRRLAERLGAAPTTLYWHVRTKDEVFDLALDEIFGDVVLPMATDHWFGDLRALLVSWYSVMLQHPWASGLLGRPLLGPNVLLRTEFLQSTLVRGGFSGVELAAATHGLANYVIGSALTRMAGGAPDVADQVIQENGDLYPTLARTGHLGEQDWDDLFGRGLDSMLTGLGIRP